jgi:hypothetical protein
MSGDAGFMVWFACVMLGGVALLAIAAALDRPLGRYIDRRAAQERRAARQTAHATKERI